MTSRLIRLSFFDCPCSSVRAKVQCRKSCDHFNCWVIDCLGFCLQPLQVATHSQQVTSLKGSYLSAKVQLAYSTALANRAEGRRDKWVHALPKVQSETASSRFWIQVSNSISYDNNHYTKHTAKIKL